MSTKYEPAIDCMMKGRSMVLEENGLSTAEIDGASSDDEIRGIIGRRAKPDAKKDNYLFAVAKKQFMPKIVDDQMAFGMFYDNCKQSTGDSAEVAMQLWAKGLGFNAAREVQTKFNEHPDFDCFGVKERLDLNHRDSDVVVKQKDGSNVHVEIKVGLTCGTKKKADLRQELYGDIYRMQHDPKTFQEYRILKTQTTTNLSLTTASTSDS